MAKRTWKQLRFPDMPFPDYLMYKTEGKPEYISGAIGCFVAAADIMIFLFYSRTFGVAFALFLILLGLWFLWHIHYKREITLQRLLIILAVVTVGTIALGFFIRGTVGQNWDVAYEPNLTLRCYSGAIPKDIPEMSTTEVKFPMQIVNVGDGDAYQITCKACFINGDPSKKGSSSNCETDIVNPLKKQDQTIWPLILNESYIDQEGVKTYVVKSWIIVVGVTYQDVFGLTRGIGYWYYYDTNANSLQPCTREQRQVFEPAVKRLFPDLVKW